jgi:chromatin assembly factor 1 subunit B
MKAGPLLVTWHNESQPIYSVHFDPHGKGRLATAGKWVFLDQDEIPMLTKPVIIMSEYDNFCLHAHHVVKLIWFKLWSIEAQGDERKVTYLSTLTRHTQPVNVVRFCPRGRYSKGGP